MMLSIHWDVDPVIGEIGPVTLTYYGLLFTGGLLLCALILKKIFERDKIPEPVFYSLAYHCAIGILVGARLGHCLFYDPAYYLSHPLEIILPIGFEGGKMVMTGYKGLASHGGTIGLFIALVMYSRKNKQNFIKTLDYLAIVAPLGAGFIRMANLMNSEIIGRPADVPWAFVFQRVDLLPRHPAQLYEAMAYFVFFLVMYGLYRSKRKLKPGFLFGLVLFLIFTFRFLIEFIKESQVAFEDGMPLNMGQILSIPFVLAGLYCMFFLKPAGKVKAVN